jgi:hypothetical protein
MVTVEVVDQKGRIVEHRQFKFYAPAAEWYEQARMLYGTGINMRFGKQKAISEE